MGASGSGKSTLMNIIGCLDVPTSGRYLLDGVDVRRLDERQLSLVRNRKIGFIFQRFNLDRRAPLRCATSSCRWPTPGVRLARSARRRAAAALAQRRAGRPARTTCRRSCPAGSSSASRSRGRSSPSPVLLLADEPTGALDSHSTAEVLALFDELDAGGPHVVVITHEDDVAAHAKRVVRMRDGRIVSDVRQAAVHDPPPRWRPALAGGRAAVTRERQRERRGSPCAGVTGEQDSVGADDARHPDRRRRGHHPGRGRHRREPGRPGPHQLAGHQHAHHHAQRDPAGRGGRCRRRLRRRSGRPVAGRPDSAAATRTTGQNAHLDRAPELTIADAEALADQRAAPDVLGVAPVVAPRRSPRPTTGASHDVGTFTGTTPSYLLINNTAVQSAGPSPTPTTPAHRRVALLGRDRRRRPRRRRRSDDRRADRAVQRRSSSR